MKAAAMQVYALRNWIRIEAHKTKAHRTEICGEKIP